MMKNHLCTIFLTIYFLLICLVSAGCTDNIKEPSVAGTFYPADKKELKETVDTFLSRAKIVPREGKLLALISPHAGYRYSGQVAAYGYRQLQDRDIRKIILIGTSHHENFRGASVYTSGTFKTPLGDVAVDEKSAKKLLNENAEVRYYPEAFANEHSLEVQLPFLQSVLKNVTIIPVLIGSPTRSTFDHLISELTELIDEKTLIIASTDLSHYHGYQQAIDMDGKLITAIERLSVMNAGELLQRGESEMCGAVPVIIAMEVAKRHGANLGVLFNYANSGDVTQEKERVVGYASMGLFRSPYTDDEKKELLSLARKAITEYVTDNKVIEVDMKDPKLRTDGAVFVTIKEKGSLRGCIGHVQAIMPLYQSVIKNAVAASTSDPRFPPMTKDELHDIDIEISILSPMQKVKDVNNIEIGRHGLVIRKGSQSGLLLPQVPTEQGWDRQTFLKQICAKAGLPEYAWKDAELFTFTADIIK
jgi:MEMO1 family protein